MNHSVLLPDLKTRLEAAALIVDMIPRLPPEKDKAMAQLTLELDEAGFVIAMVHPSNVIRLRPRRTPHDLTPCDVDPSPETAA